MDLRRHLARLRESIRNALGETLCAMSGGRRRRVARQPLLAGAASGSVSRFPHRASLATWMEDARRLRPRRKTANPSAPMSDPAAVPTARRPLAGVPVVPVNPAARLGAPGPQLVPGEGATQKVVASSPVPSAGPLPPDISVDFTALTPEALAAIESLDTTQRRLIFLRYLVRQGVYNEGFSERVLPEQYWRSRGVHGDERPAEHEQEQPRQ